MPEVRLLGLQVEEESRVVTTYPFAALLEKAGLETTSKAVRGLSISGEAFKRYTEHGLTADQADRLACRAGFHPAEVWSEWAADPFEGRHGKPWTYRCGCRCDACVQANRDYNSAYYARNKGKRRQQMAEYYEAAREYERKRRRQRYWSDPEAARAARREQYYAKKAASHA